MGTNMLAGMRRVAAAVIVMTVSSVIAQTQPVPYPFQSPPQPSQLPQPQPYTAPLTIPGRPGIAVYVFGAALPGTNKAMAARLIAALANTGRYQTADNYKEFFNSAEAEPKGRAGLISSKRLAALGMRFGVGYVCVAEIVTVYGEMQVSAHILRVGDGAVVAMGGGGVVLKSFPDLTVAAEQIVKAMLSGGAAKYAAYPALAGGDEWSAAAKFTDTRDGKTYRKVSVGGVVWMAQNLNYQAPVGSWCYVNDNSGCNTYGRLYDWNAAGAACPPGWHLPSRQEWDNLVAVGGGAATAGRGLKSMFGWSISSSGFDEYGFSALPGGGRDSVGVFSGVGGSGYWWTDTPDAGAKAYYRYLRHDFDGMDEQSGGYGRGFSVRCVQN